MKKYPAGIWCENDVVLTSMRRDYVASTLIRRHFDTKCPLGKYLLESRNSNRRPSCVLISKSNRSCRICTEYKKSKSGKTKQNSFSIPKLNDWVDKIRKRKIIKFDRLMDYTSSLYFLKELYAFQLLLHLKLFTHKRSCRLE